MRKEKKEKTMFRTFEKEVIEVTVYNKDTKALETMEVTSYDGIMAGIPAYLKVLDTEVKETSEVKIEMTISDFIKYGKEV